MNYLSLFGMGLFLGVGGFSYSGYETYENSAYLPGGIRAEIDSPEGVDLDESFEIVLTLINESDQAWFLDTLELSTDYTSGIEITRIDQGNLLAAEEEDFWDTYGFEDFKIPAEDEVLLTLEAKAIAGGSYYAGLDLGMTSEKGVMDYYFAELATDVYVEGELPETPFVDHYGYYDNYDYVYENVETRVEAPARILDVAEAFEFEVIIHNTGDTEAVLDTIDISQKFFDKGVEILSVSPKEMSEYDYDGGISYEFYDTIPADSEEVYTFTARATEPGNIAAYLDVCLDACFYEAVGIIAQ